MPASSTPPTVAVALPSAAPFTGHRSLRAWLWALPFCLAVLLVLTVAAALEASDRRDVEGLRHTMEVDALALQDKLRERIEKEQLRLDALAAHLEIDSVVPERLGADPLLRSVLKAPWVSITWLDTNNRIVVQLPDTPPDRVSGNDSSPGVSVHLLATLGRGGHSSGQLIARLQPARLLKELTPWWMGQRYDIRLTDDFDQVLGTATGTAWRYPAAPLSHRITLEPLLRETQLELALREPFRPWFKTFPTWLLVAMLAMIGWASLLLRRQMQDVRRAEGAWRTEAAWRTAMGESLRVGLRARDPEGRLLYVNRAFADMVGYGVQELVGHASPMPYWESENMDEMHFLNQRTMSGNAPREGFETRWRKGDGTVLNVLIVEAPLIDAGGQQIGWMGSVLDITERVRAQESEQRRTDAMAAQARLATLGEIASTLAHELNQPLAAISSYNAGLKNALKNLKVADGPIALALQRQAQQIEHAATIVQRIRDFLSRREPYHEPCELSEVAAQALVLLRRDLSLRRVQIVDHLPVQMPPIVGDRVLLEQVLINLIRNAADALTAGEGVSISPKVITLGLSVVDGRFARFDVCDNGPGLKGRSTEQLCQPFYSTKTDGMGMGLAICRSIIEAHYGTMDSAEVSSGGARISFILPLAASMREPETPDTRGI